MGKAVVWASRVSRARRAGGGVAHRGRLLKMDLDATAGGVFDGLLGLVAEAVALQAATVRPQGSDVGAARLTYPRPTGGRDLGSHEAHDVEGSIRVNANGEGACACVCRKYFGPRKGACF